MAKRIQTMHDINVCELVNNEPTGLRTFSGTNSECVEFVNKYLAKAKIRSFGKAQVLIEIDDVLYTEDMLKEKGALVKQ